MKYSFIIPVYNRPDEIEELLESLVHLSSNIPFEVVVVEDGSSISCKHIVDLYAKQLHISYYYKTNSGPGDSRNYGMKVAKGSYFIILDSDCIIPPNYLVEVDTFLSNSFVEFFGGPDAAHKSFSNIQKAIDCVMTSVFTTGGIRGSSEKLSKFQPRSFNMGISKKAFEASGGFGKIHPGEDPDLTIRLWKLGFKSALIPNAYVFHKRRIDWKKFYQQVKKFGKARPILNYRYPEHDKLMYWFPTIFILGYILSIIFLLIGFSLPIIIYILYFLAISIESLIKTQSIGIALLTIWATHIQFFGYGLGFFISSFKIKILKEKPELAMPEMFFK
ncbi:MAG TPA: glycosyltransferase [Flavobacterium sp.]|nr:glycosyltransferase [Flavobacterium sp.]